MLKMLVEKWGEGGEEGGVVVVKGERRWSGGRGRVSQGRAEGRSIVTDIFWCRLYVWRSCRVVARVEGCAVRKVHSVLGEQQDAPAAIKVAVLVRFG